MEEYTVTISHTAIVSINVKANSHEEAQDKAALIFEGQIKKGFQSNKICLEADQTKIAGSINNDESWNLTDF